MSDISNNNQLFAGWYYCTTCDHKIKAWIVRYRGSLYHNDCLDRMWAAQRDVHDTWREKKRPYLPNRSKRAMTRTERIAARERLYHKQIAGRRKKVG